MPPDAHNLDDWRRFLRGVQRRLWIEALVRACATGAAAGAVAWLVFASRGGIAASVATVLACCAAAGVTLWRTRSARRLSAAAACVERACPELLNVLITAEELDAFPDRALDRIRARVFADASAKVAQLAPAEMVRLGRTGAAAAAALVLWLALVVALPRGTMTSVDATGMGPTASPGAGRGAGPEFAVRVEPPAYTGQAPFEVNNPERLAVLQGSRVQLRVAGGARAWRVRFTSTILPLVEGHAVVIAELVVEESGYFAIEEAPADRTTAAPVLLPISVTADRAPVVRIERPGRDLLLPVTAAAIDVATTASDDLGLEAIELRYTKISGSGEQFEFEEGVLPLDVLRDTARAWTGRGRVPLDRLKLAPGDALVYRAVARDMRPGTDGESSSDTFMVEIQGPGQVPLEGIAMPPDQERYALSQQMVVLKIERLRAKERSLTRRAFEDEAAAIAAEQRAVRANFIFLMGGHVEDEFEEAEQSHEIQEGRLENTARRDISTAIHQMTQAEKGLTAFDAGAALPPARSAVEALQRAFGRNRYILRTLAARSRIDPSRRLSGSLSAAADWRRQAPEATVDPDIRRARLALDEILGVAETLERGLRPDHERVIRLAERLLAIAPASAEWQALSSAVLALGRVDTRASDRSASLARVNAAIAPLVALAGQDATRSPAGAGAGGAALRGAWASEVRR